jgi:hypothetical protein
MFSLPTRLFICLLIGTIIRVTLAPFTGHPFDIYLWYQASEQIIQSGPYPTYHTANIPLFFYTLVPISYLYNALSGPLNAQATPLNSLPAIVQSAAQWTIPAGQNIFVTNWLFNLLVKSPMIISDILSGLLIYKIILDRFGQRLASSSFLLWFLNPMLIWVSSVWSMFDSIPVLFVILATYLVLKNHFSLGFLSLSVAIGYKIFPVFFIIPLCVYIYRTTNSAKPIILPASLLITTCTAIFLPFQGGIIKSQMYLNTFTSAAAEPWQTFGLTYWSIAPFTNLPGWLIKYSTVTALIAVTILVSLNTILKKQKWSPGTLFYYELVSLVPVFFTVLTVLEQWFIWLLPLLIFLFAAGLIRLRFVLLLSFIALLYSWINSQFAAFFVSSYVYNPSGFVLLVKYMSLFANTRLLEMAFMGTFFSVILLYAILRASVSPGWH